MVGQDDEFFTFCFVEISSLLSRLSTKIKLLALEHDKTQVLNTCFVKSEHILVQKSTSFVTFVVLPRLPLLRVGGVMGGGGGFNTFACPYPGSNLY